jgi:hypothetical protein
MLLDVAGLALTLLTLALLAVGGYLLAVRLLGDEARSDRLALAIATLLGATAEALAIGLLLGICGQLRIELALPALALLVAALARVGVPRASRPVASLGEPSAAEPAGGDPPAPADLWQPARLLGRRAWERLIECLAFSVLTVHAAGSEALRGLLRPPLSWDALMYHLGLAATWLRRHDLAPVLGPYPQNAYGFFPGNGSIWLWWWMAPSHSEIYANLASLPHWLLLGLAVGGLARQLGARRHWPLASFLALLTPVVVRFAATEYVDLFMAATLCAGVFFTLRWLKRPRLADAMLGGTGCGLACGAKLLGLPYAAALLAAVALLAMTRGRGEPRAARVRVPQLAAALLLFAALGSFFYVRNVAAGAGPFGLACESFGKVAAAAPRGMLPALPRPDSVVDLWSSVGRHQLLDAFLGVTRPRSIELGVGPQAGVLLLAFLALPFGVAADRRAAALVAASQIACELVVWLLVPYANHQHVFANVRYLEPAFGLAVAGAVAIAEHRGMSARWLQGIALALCCQGLLQLHAEMPEGVRVALAVADVAAVAMVASAGLRRLARRHARALVLAALAVALAGAPLLVRFRVGDRARALADEWTGHATTAYLFAGGWAWLDAHGGNGAVDVVGAPGTYFVYPAMGPFLERQALYVNVNRANRPVAASYPGCNPRVEGSPAAWMENLAAAGVRWLLLDRYPEFDFPVEARWAAGRPDRFVLRYQDPTCVIFEVLPAAPSPARPPAAVAPAPAAPAPKLRS